MVWICSAAKDARQLLDCVEKVVAAIDKVMPIAQRVVAIHAQGMPQSFKVIALINTRTYTYQTERGDLLTMIWMRVSFSGFRSLVESGAYLFIVVVLLPCPAFIYVLIVQLTFPKYT